MDEGTEVLVDGVREGEAAGAIILWNDVEYPVCGGLELGGKLLGSGGFRVTAEATIVVRRDLFGSETPQEKQRLTYISAPEATAHTLRIDTRTNFRDALIILECNDPNQHL